MPLRYSGSSGRYAKSQSSFTFGGFACLGHMLQVADLVGFDMGDIAAKCTSSSSGGARRSPQTILLWRYDGDQMKCTHLYGACHALISRIAPV